MTEEEFQNRCAEIFDEAEERTDLKKDRQSFELYIASKLLRLCCEELEKDLAQKEKNKGKQNEENTFDNNGFIH